MSEMNPDQELKQTTVSDFQLAMLAATIHPEACRSGNARDALLAALALWEESTALCIELGPKSLSEKLDWLMENGALFGHCGASRLHNAICRSAKKSALILTLGMRDKEEDTLRPYLAEKLNLEGKKSGRPAWAQVRTVLENFRVMFKDHAITHNQDNAARIKERNTLDEELARKKGITVEQLRAQGGVSLHDEQWRDWEADYQSFLDRSGVRDARGKVIRYEVEQIVADMFIAWKKSVKKRGGVNKVKALRVGDISEKVPKKKIPKKVR